MTLDSLSEPTKHIGDAVSVVVAVATIAKWLPEVAALLTIIWTLIRIYETKSVQRLLGKRDE